MNKKLTILGTLLMAVAVTGYSVSGTYARYTDSVYETSEARVAKFNVSKGEHTFELFNLKNGDNETLVAPGYSGYGLVEVNAETEGYDVETTFELLTEDYTDTDNNVTKKSKTIGGEYDPLTYALVEITDEMTTDDAIEAAVAAGTYETYANFTNTVKTMETGKVYAIAWKWDNVEANNAQDTELGNAMYTALNKENATERAEEIEKYTVRISVKATVKQLTQAEKAAKDAEANA